MIHLLHGSVGRPSDWDSLIGLFDEDRATRALDLYAAPQGDLEETGAWINEQARGGDVIIGYSLGGRLALHALLADDAPWSRAVIVSADPGSGFDASRVERDRQWAGLARRDWPRFCKEWGAQALLAAGGGRFDRSVYDDARREAVARGFENWSVGQQRDLRPALEALEIPTLWIVGERDRKYVGIISALVARLPSARLEIVAEAGHRVPWDSPKAVAEVIQSFLS